MTKARWLVDRFDAFAKKPIAWQETAATFIVAANYLLKMEARATPVGFTWSSNASNSPVLLLYATAAENLLKAIRIAQGDEPVVANGRLAEYYGCHDLSKYANDAKVVLKREERSLLLKLQHVLEAGKYPVAKKPGQSSRAWSYEFPADAHRVCQLLQKLDSLLRTTGAQCLPKFDVAKLHSPGRSRRRRTRR